MKNKVAMVSIERHWIPMNEYDFKKFIDIGKIRKFTDYAGDKYVDSTITMLIDNDKDEVKFAMKQLDLDALYALMPYAKHGRAYSHTTESAVLFTVTVNLCIGRFDKGEQLYRRYIIVDKGTVLFDEYYINEI